MKEDTDYFQSPRNRYPFVTGVELPSTSAAVLPPSDIFITWSVIFERCISL